MAGENPVIRLLLARAVQCHHAGEWPQAETLYREVLRHEPQNADALNLLGVLAQQAGHPAEAEQLLTAAIAAAPSVAGYHVNLAALLMETARLDEAAESCRRAIALAPTLSAVRNNLGSCLLDLGLHDAAEDAFRAALIAQPVYAVAHSNLLWAMQFNPAHTSADLAAEKARYQRYFGDPFPSAHPPHLHDRSPHRRLRLGYVSPDFCDHVVGFNLLPLFAHHDRAAFEIFCYAHTPREDAVTQQFRTLADHWRDIAPLSDDGAADRIRQDRIDILIDLALHTADNRLLLFARKPAPVQISFAGYPGDTGLAAIDHHLTDRFLEPAGAFTVLDSFWCYTAEPASPPVGDLPAAHLGVITFGCLNRFCKINAPVLAAWAAIMTAVKNSRLVMMSPPGSARERTLATLQHHGIAPDRIRFLDRMDRHEYLRAYDDIDLCLDTFPYNGHTTSLDALWMGVPVVTLIGDTTVGRAGFSQLSNLGLPELAAHDVPQFIAIAAALAADLPRLMELRKILRTRMLASPLMDAARFTRQIESAYFAAWRDFLAASA